MNNFNLSPNTDFPSRRTPVLGRYGMGTTSQPFTVQVGFEILEMGGNAAYVRACARKSYAYASELVDTLALQRTVDECVKAS